MGKGVASQRSAAVVPVEVAGATLRAELAAIEQRLPDLERSANETAGLLAVARERVEEIKTTLTALERAEIRTDVLLAPSQATLRPLSTVLLSPNLPDWPIEHLALRSPRGIRLWWAGDEKMTVAETGARWASGHLVEPIRLRKASTGQVDNVAADQIMVETETDGTPRATYPTVLDLMPFRLLLTIPISNHLNRQLLGRIIDLSSIHTSLPGTPAAIRQLNSRTITLGTARAVYARGAQLTVYPRGPSALALAAGLVRIRQWPDLRAKRKG